MYDTEKSTYNYIKVDKSCQMKYMKMHQNIRSECYWGGNYFFTSIGLIVQARTRTIFSFACRTSHNSYEPRCPGNRVDDLSQLTVCASRYRNRGIYYQRSPRILYKSVLHAHRLAE